MIEEARKELRKFSSPADAANLQRFFKTGPGEYGEGDIFIGVKVPGIRKTAAAFAAMPFSGLGELIKSPIHEERLLALIILVKQFAKADESLREKIAAFYLKNRQYINNWDLVDLSSPYILGPYLFAADKKILFDFVRSGSLWEKRIAVLSTFYFIKNWEYHISFRLIEMLLDDGRDLINKACGWMLREIGKKNLNAEEIFLKKHYKKMPRTMLRYAIEKFPEEKRLRYLKGEIQ